MCPCTTCWYFLFFSFSRSLKTINHRLEPSAFKSNLVRPASELVLANLKWNLSLSIGKDVVLFPRPYERFQEARWASCGLRHSFAPRSPLFCILAHAWCWSDLHKRKNLEIMQRQMIYHSSRISKFLLIKSQALIFEWYGIYSRACSLI